MTQPDQEDGLQDPAMAKLMRRFGAQTTARGSAASLSPQRRAALRAQLDEVDAELRRDNVPMSPRRMWFLISAVAAMLVLGAVLTLRSSRAEVPQLTAHVARAEPPRGAPPSNAFTVDITPVEPGFARIDAFTVDGQRRTLPLRDGQLIARVDGQTRFGEFDLPDTWRLLVVFATKREVLASPDAQTPEQLVGGTAEERLLELARIEDGLRRNGIAAIELVMP